MFESGPTHEQSKPFNLDEHDNALAKDFAEGERNKSNDLTGETDTELEAALDNLAAAQVKGEEEREALGLTHEQYKLYKDGKLAIDDLATAIDDRMKITDKHDESDMHKAA